MYSRVLAASLAFHAAGQAGAAIVEYDITVARIEARPCIPELGCLNSEEYEAVFGVPPEFPEWIRDHGTEYFRIIFDESMIGRSIANWRAEFYFEPACSVYSLGGWECFSSATGIVSGLGGGVAGTRLMMEFGPAREVRHFSYFVLDGPPDWSVSYWEKDGRRGGDFSWWGASLYRSSRDVTMRLVSIDGVPVGGPAPVPLPAPFALLGVALGGLALLGRRRA